jgi:hypothetical protein
MAVCAPHTLPLLDHEYISFRSDFRTSDNFVTSELSIPVSKNPPINGNGALAFSFLQNRFGKPSEIRMIVPLLLVPTRFAGRFPAWVRGCQVEFVVVGAVWVGGVLVLG